MILKKRWSLAFPLTGPALACTHNTELVSSCPFDTLTPWTRRNACTKGMRWHQRSFENLNLNLNRLEGGAGNIDCNLAILAQPASRKLQSIAYVNVMCGPSNRIPDFGQLLFIVTTKTQSKGCRITCNRRIVDESWYHLRIISQGI